MSGIGEPIPSNFLTMAKRENIIPYEPVGRLIEAAGAERVSSGAKAELAEYLTGYAMELGKLAARYAAHAGRTTVTDKDIRLAETSIEKR